MRFQKPCRIAVDAGREAQQHRVDVEAGLRTLEDCYAELGQDFEEQAEIRAQNARFLFDLATKYGVPFEMLYRPSGGTVMVPTAVAGAPENDATGTGAR